MALRLKLTYFDMAGRGELTRLIFAYGNVVFEDERLTDAEFQVIKPTLPLGQLPILQVHDETYAQSMTIARYAAKMTGLYPQDPVAGLRADMVSETLSELRNKFSGILHGGFDDATKAQKFDEYKVEVVPKALASLETMVQGTFLAGDDASYADVQLFDFVENVLWTRMNQSITSSFPKLQGVVNSVKATLNIAAYLAKQQQ